MQEQKIEPEFPECAAYYLAEYLFEVGPTTAAGMGEAPITELEVAAWQSNTGIQLTSWEARTLRSLSKSYLAESHRAKSPTHPSPLAPIPSDDVRKKVLPNRIKEALRG